MKPSIKEVITNDNWVITRIIQGYNGQVRIDAKTRNRIADGINNFSEWCKESYADRLTKNVYGKKLHDMNAFSY